MADVFQVGVKIIFLHKKTGKMLFLRRSKKKYPEFAHNPLDIVGGRINWETKLLENLKREIFEETGWKLPKKIKLISAQDIFFSGNHVVRLTYLANVLTMQTPKLSDEHDMFFWLNPREILKNKKKIDPFALEVVKDLVTG